MVNGTRRTPSPRSRQIIAGIALVLLGWFCGVVTAGKEGVGSGVLNMSRMVGFALGIAICVALLSSFTPTHVSDAQAEVRAIVMEDQQIPASI